MKGIPIVSFGQCYTMTPAFSQLLLHIYPASTGALQQHVQPRGEDVPTGQLLLPVRVGMGGRPGDL